MGRPVMRNTLLFCACLFMAACSCFAQANLTDGLSIMTYYPSPSGSFKNIRIFPTQEPPAGHPARRNGSMYINDTDNKLYIFNQTAATWERVNGVSLWSKNGNNLTNANTGNVGIGVANPREALEVNGVIYAWDDVCIPGNKCVSQIPH